MRRRPVRWSIRAALGATAILAAFVLVRWTTGNFGTVVPGRVYRSAQLSGEALSARIREHGVRTVLNLRGPNPDETWYRRERQATLERL